MLIYIILTVVVTLAKICEENHVSLLIIFIQWEHLKL